MDKPEKVLPEAASSAPASRWRRKVLPFTGKANPPAVTDQTHRRAADSIHIFCGQLCGCFGEKATQRPWQLPPSQIDHFLINLKAFIFQQLMHLKLKYQRVIAGFSDKRRETRNSQKTVEIFSGYPQAGKKSPGEGLDVTIRYAFFYFSLQVRSPAAALPSALPPPGAALPARCGWGC